MADRDGRPERLGDLLAPVAALLAERTRTHRSNGDPTMTLTVADAIAHVEREGALRTPVPPAAPTTPPASRAAVLDAHSPQEAASGSPVDNWLCGWCDNTRDLTAGITCPCMPAAPRVIGDVAARHRAAVRRARSTTR